MIEIGWVLKDGVYHICRPLPGGTLAAVGDALSKKAAEAAIAAIRHEADRKAKLRGIRSVLR